jgi:hypothetical protein
MPGCPVTISPHLSQPSDLPLSQSSSEITDGGQATTEGKDAMSGDSTVAEDGTEDRQAAEDVNDAN